MSEREKVVLWNEGGSSAIWGETEWYGEDEESDYGQEEFEQFAKDFTFKGYRFMANPNEDFYQGVNFMSVWERNSDGKKFGFQFWEPVSKHGEAYYESNGDEHGFDWEDERGTAWVFQEIEPFTITGYQFRE